MSFSILATKLYFPSAYASLVSRPHLVERLNSGLRGPLTVLCAPAGYGKTTLMSEWRAGAGRGISATWLSLDEGDNDLARFIAYLAAALQTIEPDLGSDCLRMYQLPKPPELQEFIPVLINQIDAINHDFVLVLDDYHVIVSADIHRALTFILENHPSKMHLVILTRKDPPLPLPRLRARGQLVELRQGDLRFTTEETAEFLKQRAGVELSNEEVASLNSRIEGWAAGLQMAALSVRDKEDASRIITNFTGGHRYIVDYFATEVLAQQPEPTKSFLLQTSILNRLCGPLCDAVTGQMKGQETLEQLRQANLFVGDLDSERRWYRYHHLFSDLLRKQLQQKTLNIIPDLHMRASCWYEQAGLIVDAIDHALSACNYDRAVSLISRILDDSLWKRGESITIVRWLESLPEETFYSQPHLCAFHALTLFLTGQLNKAELRLQIAERLLEGEILPNEHSRDENRGMVAAVRAYIAYFQGDAQAIIRLASQALELLPKENLMWRNSAAINLGDAYSITGNFMAAQQAYHQALKASQSAGNLFLASLAGGKLALTYKHQGHLKMAEEICRQLIQHVNTSENLSTGMAGRLFAIWGDILCEWHELENAEAHVRKAVELSQHEGNIASLGLGYLYLLRILLAKQDFNSMHATLSNLELLTQKSNVPFWISEGVISWKSWIWICQGNFDAAEQVLREHGITSECNPGFGQEGEYISLARLLLAQGRPEQTDTFLKKLYVSGKAKGDLGLMIVCLCLRAVASDMQGLRNEALSLVENAISLAAPGGYVQIFLEEGRPMANLLHDVATRGIARQYAGRLLAAFPMTASPSNQRSTQTDEIVEPLSERELDVLRLVAEGLTNQEIAARLYVSLRTVKFHTGNIYGKLGAKGRTEAVAKARSLGLLSQ